ncbi:MAG: diguanylate cyclase [Clostridia bacterium]|nr:diguanylate cyclase [Clostridia bacterium]
MRFNDYDQLFHASLDAMVRIDNESNILEVNRRFIDFFGYSSEDILHRKLDDVVVCAALREESALLDQRISTGELITMDSTRMDRHGVEHHVFITGIPIIENKTYKGAYVIYRNRTMEVESERKLLNQKVTFESLFRNSNDAIVHIDVHQRVIDINERFETLFEYTLEEIKGEKVDPLISRIDFLDETTELTDRLMSGEKIVVEGLRYSKNGYSRMYLVQGVPIVAAGTVIGGYGIYTDITERKNAENEVIYMSYHDQLTGLYNRRFFEEEFNRLNTQRHMPMSLIMGDVNGLKLVNDAFGHEAGDEFLKRIASTLRDNYREGELIARLSGDEFVILLPNTTTETSERILQRLKLALSCERFRGIELSMSFGCSSKIDQAEPNSVLFKRVEDMMYRHKLVESPKVKGEIFESVIKILHAKNEREELHSMSVSLYCGEIAEALGMNPRFLLEMKTLGWLHDIGKIAISDSILDKPGALTEEEWKEVKKHPEIGYRILNSVHEFTELSGFVLHHHEWYDGSGYPKGIAGEDIPIQSRILAVADAYEAMVSDRTYREALSQEEAIEELRVHKGDQFDPNIVDIFVSRLRGKQNIWKKE